MFMAPMQSKPLLFLAALTLPSDCLRQVSYIKTLQLLLPDSVEFSERTMEVSPHIHIFMDNV